MPDVRCPKHDRIFTTITDHRMPGSGAAKSGDTELPAHPLDGHPDCPKCQEDAKEAKNEPAAEHDAGQ